MKQISDKLIWLEHTDGFLLHLPRSLQVRYEHEGTAISDAPNMLNNGYNTDSEVVEND